mgnify:CR=1 FL=1
MALVGDYANNVDYIDYGEDDTDETNDGSFVDCNAIRHGPNCQRSISAKKFPRSPFLHTETCTCGASDDTVAALREQVKELERKVEEQFNTILHLNSMLPAHQPVFDRLAKAASEPLLIKEPTQLALDIADPSQMAMDLDAGAKVNTEPPTGCSCHPDDNPPDPCPRKHALTECREAAAQPAIGIVGGTDVAQTADKSDLKLTPKDLNQIQSLLVSASRIMRVDKSEAIESIRRKIAFFHQEPMDDEFLATVRSALDDIPITFNWASHYRGVLDLMLFGEG